VSYKVYARHGGAAGASQDDITARVPALDDNNVPLIQMGMSFQTGSASVGSFIVPDPVGNLDSSLYFPPHTQITWTEDASGDELWLARGRTSTWGIKRADIKSGANVQWNFTVDDGNVDLRGMAFTEDWVRPAETGTARLYALALYTLNGTSSTRPASGGVISYRPSTTITIDPDHLAPDLDTVVMPAQTYKMDTQPLDVVTDCAETEGKVFGVVIHHTGGTSHLCLRYTKEIDYSTYASTCKISDDIADIDEESLTAPVFYPIYDQGDAQQVDGNANISGIVSRYGPDDQAIAVLSATLGDNNEYWVDSVQDGRSVDPTQAAYRAASVVASRAPYQETDSLSIIALPEQTHLICAGMSIQIKAVPINTANTSTVGSYIDRNIATLQWEPLPDGRYHGILQLNRPMRAPGGGAAQSASTSPTGAPDCGDEMPVGFALGVDGDGWVKTDDNFGGVPVDEWKAINVSASGSSAILTNGPEQRFTDGFGDFSYYTGAQVTKADYAPAVPPHLLIRFTITELGNSNRQLFFGGFGYGASIFMPYNTGAFPGDEHDGQIQAVNSADDPVDFTLTVDQAYFLRVNNGNVKIWEVEDAEPGSWTAGNGSWTGPVTFVMALQSVSNAGGHDTDFTPSTVEVESVIAFALVDDPFCLTDPGTSPYYARSDDPRFDTIVTDHGGLTGLLDDDHTQYIKDTEFTAKGDLLVGSGSGTFDNLPVGTNGKALVADSTQTLGVKWDTVTGSGSGPFEDVDTFTWKFTSPANAISSTDESAFLELDTDAAILRGGIANEIDVTAVTGKISLFSDFGVVFPVEATQPAGGDSEDGQAYYDSATDQFRYYRNGSWTQTRKLFLPAAEAKLDSATAANIGASPDLTGVVAYADAATQGAFWSFMVPDDWDSGVITLQPVWSPGSTDGTAHTVRWSIIAKTVANGTTVTAAGTTTTFTGSSGARTVGVVVYDTATSTTLTPAAAGDVFRFTLRRIGADGADTYVGTVNLLGVIVSYQAI